MQKRDADLNAERNELSIHEEDASVIFRQREAGFYQFFFATDENFLGNDTPEVPVVTRRISS